MLRETEIVLKLHDIIANYCREKDIDYIVGGLFLKIFLERVDAGINFGVVYVMAKDIEKIYSEKNSFQTDNTVLEMSKFSHGDDKVLRLINKNSTFLHCSNMDEYQTNGICVEIRPILRKTTTEIQAEEEEILNFDSSYLDVNKEVYILKNMNNKIVIFDEELFKEVKEYPFSEYLLRLPSDLETFFEVMYLNLPKKVSVRDFPKDDYIISADVPWADIKSHIADIESLSTKLRDLDEEILSTSERIIDRNVEMNKVLREARKIYKSK